MATKIEMNLGKSRWIDICGPNEAELLQLSQEFQIPEPMLLACLDPDHLPKVYRADSFNFAILRAYDERAPQDSSTVQECTRKLAIFIGEHFLLTIHRAPLSWVQTVWAAMEKKQKPLAAAGVMHDLIEECIFTYETPIDASALEMEKLEEMVFQSKKAGSTSSEILEAAYLAKKRASLFKRLLRLTRDLLPQVSRLGEANSPAIQGLKEEADRFYFYSDDLVETSNDLVQLSISLTADRTNHVVRLLTLVSIFLMPLNLVVGIYGMNFQEMPELRWKFGYPGVLLFMVALEVMIYFVLRRMGWIHTSKKDPAKVSASATN